MLHPVHNTSDGHINSFLRHKIDLNNPTPEVIDIREIANNLSKICRFGGAIKEHYSVAQHCVMVCNLAGAVPGKPMEFLLAALLHDAPEAYLGDVVKPLKNLLGDTYRHLEVLFEMAICRKYDLKWVDLMAVKPFDKRAIEIEYNYFFRDDHSEFTRIFNSENPCWPHELAAELFLYQFNQLYDNGKS